MDIKNLRFLSKTHRSLHDQRRQYEWKVFISTITIYVLAVTTKIGGDFKFENDNVALFVIIFSCVLIAGVSILYLCDIHKVNQINQSVAEKAENCIIEHCEFEGIKNILDKANEKGKSARHPSWSLVWQIVTIAFFAYISIFLLIFDLK